jgi:hypothetical protein
MSMNVVEASGLGKRYGSTWALRECTLEAPPVTWPRWPARTARARARC